jgi:hypothetical protein
MALTPEGRRGLLTGDASTAVRTQRLRTRVKLPH